MSKLPINFIDHDVPVAKSQGYEARRELKVITLKRSNMASLAED